MLNLLPSDKKSTGNSFPVAHGFVGPLKSEGFGGFVKHTVLLWKVSRAMSSIFSCFRRANEIRAAH